MDLCIQVVVYIGVHEASLIMGFRRLGKRQVGI